MNQYTNQGLHQQSFPRNVHPRFLNQQGVNVPPPPLPPWSNQANTFIPPPPLPPHFPPPQFPPSLPSAQFHPSFSTFPPPQFPQKPVPSLSVLGTSLEKHNPLSKPPSDNQVKVDTWLRSRQVVKNTPKVLKNSKLQVSLTARFF